MYAVIVSSPDKYFTYSARMWGGKRAVTGGSGRKKAAASTTIAPHTRPPVTALYRPLPPIRHPPDLAAHVVADEQRAIRRHNDAHRPAPARAVGTLPPSDEIVDRRGFAIDHLHPHDLVPCGDRAVPRAVERHERVAAVVGRERRARIEVHAEGRRVRLERDRRGLDGRAVGGRVLGVLLTGKVALRPAVVLPILDDVDPFRRHVVAQVVAVVVRRPQLARRGVDREADGVAQPARKDAAC